MLCQDPCMREFWKKFSGDPAFTTEINAELLRQWIQDGHLVADSDVLASATFGEAPPCAPSWSGAFLLRQDGVAVG